LCKYLKLYGNKITLGPSAQCGLKMAWSLTSLCRRSAQREGIYLIFFTGR